MTPADHYREMYRTGSEARPPVTDDKLLKDFEAVRQWAIDLPSGPYFTEVSRANWIIWATIGSFVFGRTEHLEEALDLLNRYPETSRNHPCRNFIRAIRHLLPLSDGLWSSDRAGVATWYRDNKDRLKWDEEAGRYDLVTS